MAKHRGREITMKNFTIVFLALVLSSAGTEACKCREIVERDNICSSDFVGIVRSNDSGTITEERRKTYAIQVSEVWRIASGKNVPVTLETSESSASCGVDLTARSEYLLTGTIKSGGSLFISSCGSIVREVSSLDNEKKNELKGYSDSCSPTSVCCA